MTLIITSTAPNVRRKTVTFSLGRDLADNRGWSTAEELRAYAKSQQVPEGVAFSQEERPEWDLVEYTWTWWEVTL